MLKLLLRDTATQDVWITPNHNEDKRLDDFHREIKQDILKDVSKKLKSQYGENFDVEISNEEIYMVSQEFDRNNGTRKKTRRKADLLAKNYFERFSNDLSLVEIGKNLQKAKHLAIEYKILTGKSLGITSEVAEYEAAVKLNCTLCSARNPGHDLIDAEGKKVQVKGRVIGDNIQRVATILENSPEKLWDYVLLVLLDEKYELLAIYKANEEDIEREITRERPRGGKPRRNLLVTDFVRISVSVWPTDI